MPGHRSFFVPAVAENLLCRICHLPVRNAVQISVCGHRFCDSCLNSALSEMRNGRLKCPVDSSNIDYSEIYADDVTNQLIMSLTVICDQYKEGCKWKGQLKHLKTHVDECKYVLADCPYICGAKVQKCEMSEHTHKDCPKRRVNCPKCRREMTYEQLKSHSCPAKRNADEEMITCPSGCGARMRKQNKSQHLRICPNRWIYCQHCGTEVVYRDRQEHLSQCRVYNSRQPGGIIRGGAKRSSVNTTSVRFDVQNVRNRSRHRASVIHEVPTPPPPLRSVSFPASLNHIGRDEPGGFGSQALHRGSSREQMSRSNEELDSDVFTCTCGRRILRGQITSHMSDHCPRRLTHCQHCSIQIKYEDMQTHHQSCPAFPLSCPNNCGVAQIPRSEVDRHLSRNCRSNVIPQRGLQRHLDDYVHKHLELVSDLAIQQQKEINSLKEIVQHCKPYHDSKLIWRIDNFWERFDQGKRKPGFELQSPVFYTSIYGYKFKVVLFPYGNGSGEGTHLSLYIRLLPGEYDALLRWPYEGEVTLTLMDQSEDRRARRHISQSFSPDPNWKSFQRPTNNTRSLGFGYPQFVSHRGLESTGYVKDDTLFLKVMVDCKHSADV
ncbi:TNF receptor-associated factor 4-like isoform X2 [Actinia tenebrosa]|uniref:TNF receptor-associated factor 4-like isoform X2 n=1 Tax=Actinia tenebrosa TaxID=6105 RepID=A0A6P8GZ00_ACTTE|nr:TNF receptor-associated factor 4-like isoform X2 [Actinia tenebrosa]